MNSWRRYARTSTRTCTPAAAQASPAPGFTQVRGQLVGAVAGLEQITGLLNTLIIQQGDRPGETS
jgi:hypothetical protein